jgi:hypothetical protein
MGKDPVKLGVVDEGVISECKGLQIREMQTPEVAFRGEADVNAGVEGEVLEIGQAWF